MSGLVSARDDDRRMVLTEADDDVRLAALAKLAGFLPRHSPSALLSFSDQETTFTVTARDELFVLEQRDRGTGPFVFIESPSLDVVRRHLIEVLGDSIRVMRGMAFLVPRDAELPAGFDLHEDATGATLTWLDDAGAKWARFPGGSGKRTKAVSFARFARLDEAALIAELISA